METGRWSGTRNLCPAPYLVICHLSHQPSVFPTRPLSPKAEEEEEEEDNRF
jgi:hypothetical protein